MFLTALLFAFVSLYGCAEESLKDGLYSAESSADDTGAWGTITITVSGGKIADVEYVTYQRDGKLKGEDYGKVAGVISNQAFYDKAQLAVRAMRHYAERLKESGSLDEVDAVSGATVSHGQFLESAEKALQAARRSR